MSDQAREETIDDLAGDDDRVVLDVRSPEEFASGHVPGAINVPLEDVLADALASVESVRPTDGADLHVICRSGGRSLKAASALVGAGQPAVSVAGGTDAWIESGRSIDT